MTEQRFKELVNKWHNDTAFLSSITEKAEHPAYQEIISMGRDAIPFIMRSIEQDGPDHWDIALHEITGENPIPPEAAGYIDRINNIWLSWAKENNIDW